VVQSYPRAVGAFSPARPQVVGAIGLNAHFVVKGEEDDCLVTTTNGGWGRLNNAGYKLLVALDGKSIEDAAYILSLTPAEVCELLVKPAQYGLIKMPGLNPTIASSSNRPSELGMLVLKVTDHCNINCRYCYNAEVVANNGKRLDLDRGKAILRSAIDYSKAGLNIVFHGGEPFIELLLLEQLCGFATAHASMHGKTVCFNIQTNATLISDRAIAFLKKFRVGLGISLDGPSSLNALRVDHYGHPAFDRIMNGIRRVQDAGLPVNVITVITALNAKHLYDIVLAFQGMKFKSVKFSSFLQQGYGSRSDSNASMEPVSGDVIYSFRNIIRGIVEGVIADIYVEDIGDFIQRCLSSASASMCHKGPCGAATDMLAVYPTGDVFACDCLVHHKFHLGNISAGEALAEIVPSSSVVATLRRRNVRNLEPCRRCAIAQMCGGTMTCRAFWANGDAETVNSSECHINQEIIVALLWQLTESRRLLDYFLRWNWNSAEGPGLSER
jgi:uncharacterized protein